MANLKFQTEMTPALSKITVCYSQLVVEPLLEKWILQGNTMLS